MLSLSNMCAACMLNPAGPRHVLISVSSGSQAATHTCQIKIDHAYRSCSWLAKGSAALLCACQQGYVQQNQAISAPCCLLQGAVAYLLQKIEYRFTVAMGLKGAAGHITHANTIPGFASALTGHVLDRDISHDCSCTHGTCTVQRRRCVDDMSAVLMCCCRTLPGEANYSLCPYT